MYEVQADFFKEANKALAHYARNGTETLGMDISRIPGALTPKGKSVFQLTTQQSTGRLLTYRSYDSPSWVKGNTVNFSPTEMKNYPVQSISTGDIVPMALGIVVIAINNMFTANEVVIVNTVHDSIVFDAATEDIAIEVCDIAGAIMANAPAAFEHFFGVPFDLDLPVEATFGPNWKQQDKFVREYN